MVSPADFNAAKRRITDLERRAKTLESGLVVVTDDVTALQTDLSTAEASIADHETRLGAIEGAWPSYTPTVTQGVEVTKTVTYSEYIQIGKTVIWKFRLDLTSAGTATAAVVLSLPVTAETQSCHGGGFWYDASSGNPYSGIVIIPASSTSVNFLVTSALQANVFGDTETLASGDVLAGGLTYQAA
jgi:hypothetical protein